MSTANLGKRLQFPSPPTHRLRRSHHLREVKRHEPWFLPTPPAHSPPRPPRELLLPVPLQKLLAPEPALPVAPRHHGNRNRRARSHTAAATRGPEPWHRCTSALNRCTAAYTQKHLHTGLHPSLTPEINPHHPGITLGFHYHSWGLLTSSWGPGLAGMLQGSPLSWDRFVLGLKQTAGPTLESVVVVQKATENSEEADGPKRRRVGLRLCRRLHVGFQLPLCKPSWGPLASSGPQVGQQEQRETAF
nr:uncharacterized protein LOC121468363 [Taeniopygia guttata]